MNRVAGITHALFGAQPLLDLRPTGPINAIIEKDMGMDFYDYEERDILRLGDALGQFTDGRIQVRSSSSWAKTTTQTSSRVGIPATSKTVDRFFSAKDRGPRRIA